MEWGGGWGGGIILYLECITDLRDTHVYIWFQYCSHSNIPCMEINWSWEPPPPARKLAQMQVQTQKLMRVSWRVQVAHNPVLVVTVDTVKALKCWFDIVYIYIYTCIPEETCWMACKLWTFNSRWKVDTEKLSQNRI